MEAKWLGRAILAAALALTLTAVFKELEKPKKERKWYGAVAGIVPYDFRSPTTERFIESVWNPYETRVLTPPVFGIGWAVNLHSLFESLGVIDRDYISEEEFLMPGKHMREVLMKQRAE
ncbi:MAG: hypothetical protein Q8O16_03995 [Dehalococcoidia bacterium]|nr:hypothetical protein [Dehalococcoidia bacterium]